MKGNQFKNTKKQSFGYEPKEYARYTRQKENRNDKTLNLLEIFKSDNEGKIRQYKKFITKLIQEDYRWYDKKIINPEWVLLKIFENKSYNCFYFIRNIYTENNIRFFKMIPEDFDKMYKERLYLEDRAKKIQKLKDNIEKKTV